MSLDTMETAKTFRTKNGYCHIFPHKIVLSAEEELADPEAASPTGNKLVLLLSIYISLAFLFMFFAYQDYHKDDKIFALFWAIVGVCLLTVVFRSRNNSDARVINRDQILKVNFVRSRPAAARGYFEVFFTNHNGNEKRRLILLPGAMANGAEETERALAIMREEKLL